MYYIALPEGFFTRFNKESGYSTTPDIRSAFGYTTFRAADVTGQRASEYNSNQYYCVVSTKEN